MKKSAIRLPIFIYTLSIAFFQTACLESDTSKGATLGAAFGSLAGVLSTGNDSKHRERALKGAALGALAGGAIGYYSDHKKRNQYHRQQRGPETYEPIPPQTTPTPHYPVAQKTTNPGYVRSPYPPHHLIDVTEFNSGDLVVDPSIKNGENVFRVP